MDRDHAPLIKLSYAREEELNLCMSPCPMSCSHVRAPARLTLATKRIASHLNDPRTKEEERHGLCVYVLKRRSQVASRTYVGAMGQHLHTDGVWNLDFFRIEYADAVCPEETANPAAAPSKAAILCSRTSQVGFMIRV